MEGVPLITGATGFAGSHLLDRLIGLGCEVNALSHTGGKPATPRSGVQWTAVDLLDREAVRRLISEACPSVIYHCAGQADVNDAWKAPARSLRLNVLATHNLLEACRDAGIDCRVVITGSAMVYAPSTDPISEDHPLVPSHPYGVTKLAQEMTAAASGLPVLLARPFNHAGPRQSPAYVTSAFAQQIARIEAGLASPVLQVGNVDSLRDITDVRDTVRAYQVLADRGTPLRPYNVCNGRAYRVRDLLDTLLSLARVRIDIELDPGRLRASDNPVICGSHARLTTDTGWTPEIPIERTMADLLEYWRRATATA